MFERWFALDIGAYEIRLYDQNRHMDAKMRTVMAMEKGELIALGQDAFSYLYKGPKVEVRYPIWEDDIDASLSRLLKKCFEKLEIGQSLLKPCILLAIPDWYDEERKLSMERILLDSGIKKIRFITNTDLLWTREACFLIHAGHSYTEMGIYVNGTRRAYKKISFAGSRIDDQIKKAVATKTNCLITSEDACSLKHACSDVFWKNRNASLQCHAMDRYQHLGQITISASDLWPALEMVEKQIVLWAKQCFKEQSLDLKQALLQKGIHLSGGLAHCFGLPQMLEQAFGCPILVSSAPEYDIINAMKEELP